MRVALLALAALTISGCASLGQLHAGYNCGNGVQSGWALIDPPANADAYRAIARATPDPGAANARGREYWFMRDGVTKYCVVDGRPVSCETPSGVWWEFTPTDEGLRGSVGDYGVCLT